MQITNRACDFNSCFIAQKPQLDAKASCSQGWGWAGMADRGKAEQI